MEPRPRASLAKLDTEMAPLQGLSPFRLTHCMNEGQMTPPASPSLPQARHGPKLQLSNLFRRSKSIISKPVGYHDRPRTTTIRPSVVEMKAPFPLLLPDCPSVTETSPSIPNASPGLRRTSTSYYDLRAFAQRQANSRPGTPLLPSPISRGPDEPSRRYFNLHNHCKWRDSLADTDSINSEEILTYYCDDIPTHKQPTSGYRRDSWASDDTQIDDEEQSTASESIPVTPSGQEYCETICSDESGWLANTTSHQERMRRFKTRLYQVVQQPWTSTFKGAGEDEVMIATVLVGPGKPKLVQIQRPPSSQASQEAEISQVVYEDMNNGELVLEQTMPSDIRPSTPIQRPLEISAFSPYDTPGQEDTSNQHISIDSCISTAAYAGSHVEDNCGKISPSSENLVPAPLSFPSRTRTSRSDSSIFSSTLQRLQELVDPFGASSASISTSEDSTRSRRRLKRSNSSRGHSQVQKHQIQNHHRDSQSWPIDDFPRPNKQSHLHRQNQQDLHSHRLLNSSLDISPTHRPATLTRLRKLHRLNRVLTAVTQAIDHFPSTPLNLSSPTVLELRPSNVPAQKYVDALKRIFPSTSTTLLESLAAWILIDLFFEGVRGGSPSSEAPNIRSRLNSGLSFRSTTLSSSRSFFSGCELHPHSNMPINHYHCRRESNPSGTVRSNNNTSIPNKAQRMLGINTPDVTSLRLSEHALQKRAESVSVSVAVVGQRLVEAVRGSAGWDEDVWRALRVLVGVIGAGGAVAGCGSEMLRGSRTRRGLGAPCLDELGADGHDHDAYSGRETRVRRMSANMEEHEHAEVMYHEVALDTEYTGEGGTRTSSTAIEKIDMEVGTQRVEAGGILAREQRLSPANGQGHGQRDSDLCVGGLNWL
ncbi:hypothetical protein LTR84_007409 [Exophiala bonariae]|uniref:Uncharacterized protein n=1 Tax=Exophiala bonariae TaxID=1690606 RepID=A0AAV9N1F8_9EURO|nr:hypothetical protein LTR84_007409 [Exophiala bonariae]